MGLMVMRRRDPEWSSYGSEEKGGGNTVKYMLAMLQAEQRKKIHLFTPVQIYIRPIAMGG